MLDLLWELAQGCCGSLILLVVVAAAITAGRDRLWLRRFLREHEGKVFLVCKRGRDWYEFINNNVAPVLPDVTIVWLERNSRSPVVRALSIRSLKSYPRPMLVLVTARRLRTESLHAELVAVKEQSAKRRPELQQQVQSIVAKALQRLGARRSPNHG